MSVCESTKIGTRKMDDSAVVESKGEESETLTKVKGGGMEALKGPMMMANALIGGTAVVFLLSTVLATVVFDEPGANTTVSDQEIQLAMQVFPTDAHIEVWMDAVLPLHIVVDILNITKIDADGNGEPGGLVDLFPVGEPATGRGVIMFKMAVVDRSELPDLMNRTQEVIPMVFIKSETFNPVKGLLRLGAVFLNNVGIAIGLLVITSLGMIGAGAGLLVLDKKKRAVNAVAS